MKVNTIMFLVLMSLIKVGYAEPIVKYITKENLRERHVILVLILYFNFGSFCQRHTL